METFFDYNPTAAELKRFNINDRTIDLFKLSLTNNNNRLYTLGMLFAMRKDYERANYYWSQIKDSDILSTLIEDF
jgi:hypothetical protein